MSTTKNGRRKKILAAIIEKGDGKSVEAQRLKEKISRQGEWKWRPRTRTTKAQAAKAGEKGGKSKTQDGGKRRSK